MQETAIHRQVSAARSQKNPRVIARLRSGFVVLGERQVVKGYCLLLADPVVVDVEHLSREQKSQFFEDLTLVGEAVKNVTNCKRINYEILGNLEPALHAHVFPRYADEPATLATRPIWFYDWELAESFDESKHAPLMSAIRVELERISIE